MKDITLGKLADDEAQRDAVHVAIAPVIAAQKMNPGQSCGLVNRYDNTFGPAASSHCGVVDPFLKEPVLEGERFWLLMYPKTVADLRHVWTHDQLPELLVEEQEVDDSCRGC